jgi:hypothetical protein
VSSGLAGTKGRMDPQKGASMREPSNNVPLTSLRKIQRLLNIRQHHSTRSETETSNNSAVNEPPNYYLAAVS